MKHRIYRLRDTLRHIGACQEFVDLCDQFKTAEQVGQWCEERWRTRADATGPYLVRHHVRWAVIELAHRLDVEVSVLGVYDEPEAHLATFKDLWQQYADRHGLYEEEEVDSPPVGSEFYFYHVTPGFQDPFNGERCQVASRAGMWVRVEGQRGLGLVLPEEMFMHRRGE